MQEVPRLWKRLQPLWDVFVYGMLPERQRDKDVPLCL